MYLVHALVQARPGAALPADTRSLVLAHAREEDGVEHVSVHPHALPHPVLGLYVQARNLADAESRATALCRRVLTNCPEFDGWSLLSAQAPLVAPFYEALLSSSVPEVPWVDRFVQGRFGPPENPSTPPDQRRK